MLFLFLFKKRNSTNKKERNAEHTKKKIATYYIKLTSLEVMENSAKVKKTFKERFVRGIRILKKEIIVRYLQYWMHAHHVEMYGN